MQFRGRLILLFVLALSLTLGPRHAAAQLISERYTISSANDSILILPDSFLVRSSIRLRLDSTLDLEYGRDFVVDDTSDIPRIILQPNLRALLYGQSLSGAGSTKEHHIELHAEVVRTALKRRYTLFEPVITTDSAGAPHVTMPPPMMTGVSPAHAEDNITFQKSGGITRGLQVGSSQDATFNNSFNLTFSGAVGDALEFKGALSEESTPLQPEGNTQTLRDIDRIYIELHSPHLFTATIGDFPLSLDNIRQDSIPSATRYDQISRKVLGAMAAVQAGPTAVAASYSITKGQFTTNSLAGIDGVQGPYRLTGKNGEQAIIVIAGTEHVYIDGELLTRGEQNDYVIDYGLSQIQFTPKRIVTSFSRITVDFEYTNEQYSRNLVAAKQSTSLFDNRINFATSYLREGDDQNNPKELTLSDSDKRILAAAGNDPSKAAKSGVTIVPRDSNGRAKGYYSAFDTTIASGPVHFYRYAPFDTLNSVYNISFGFAGAGKGQYIRQSIGEYVYVGAGLGDYDTLFFLPLPQLHQLFSGTLTVRPFENLAITADGAMSGLTLNRFSDLGASIAGAYCISGGYADTFSVAGVNNAFAKLSAKSTFTAGAFAPFDRIRSVESMRGYGIDNTASGTAQLGADEREQLVGVHGGISRLAAGFDFGSYVLGEQTYTAKHYVYSLNFDGKGIAAPDATIRYNITPTTDSSLGAASTWRVLNAIVSKRIADSLHSFVPAVAFSFADRKSTPLRGSPPDSLLGSSFRYQEISPSLGMSLGGNASMNATYTYRADDSARAGAFRSISHSSQFVLGSAMSFASGFSGRFDVGYHARTFTDSIASRVNGGDNTSVLLHLIPRYRMPNGAFSIDADYQVSELRTAAMQRLFFAVPPGQGNYTYVGDLNNNGKQDPEEFQPARYSDQGTYILITIPTDQLQPTVDLHSQLRLRLAPSQLDAANPLHFFSPISLESFVRIDENSTDPTSSDIYLYRLSHFLKDSLTIRGSQEFMQDVFLFENASYASFRFRWDERTSAAQYNTGLERSYHRELSLRSRVRLTEEITSEENLGLTRDNVATDALSTNRPQQTTRYSADARFSYDPFAARTGYSLFASYQSIADPLYLTRGNAMINTLRLSARYAISSVLTLRAEVARNEFVARTAPDLFLPFGVSGGLIPGLTWQWSIGADQEISRGVLLNASYEGRSEPSGTGHHITNTARAEIRASF